MGWTKGKPKSEETKRKFREYWADKSRSGEHRKKISEISKSNAGPDSSQWKGGLIVQKGYVYVWQPSHPRANVLGYVKRADLVMEERLGRHLVPGEVVHHEGNKDDDRREMLILFKCHGDHMRHHAALRRRRNHGRRRGKDVSRRIRIPA